MGPGCADGPTERFWRGVEGVDAGDQDVTVRFRDGVDPRLRDVGGVRVACHLRDPKLAPDSGIGSAAGSAPGDVPGTAGREPT